MIRAISCELRTIAGRAIMVHETARGPYVTLWTVAGGDTARREELRRQLGRAAYALRAIARDCNAVVVVLSSVARASERELLAPWGLAWPDFCGISLRELIGLGKESGEIEFGADSVTVLAETEPDEAPCGRRFRVGVPKVRNGGAGELTLLFDGARWREDPPAMTHAPMPPRPVAEEPAKERNPWRV